jgi:hypothetical protein
MESPSAPQLESLVHDILDVIFQKMAPSNDTRVATNAVDNLRCTMRNGGCCLP